MAMIFLPAVLSALSGKRRCPKCGTVQDVPKAQRRLATRCRKCGNQIPPPAPVK